MIYAKEKAAVHFVAAISHLSFEPVRSLSSCSGRSNAVVRFSYRSDICSCSSYGTTLTSPEESFIEDASFGDIAGHWAKKGIKAWTVRQLAGGYPDGTFRPDSPITRAEFLTMLNRAFGYTNMADLAGGQITDSVTDCDVAETDWYAAEIVKAATVGYLGGYPDGTVKPQNPITRQEAAALLAKILPPTNFAKDKNEDGSNDTVDSLFGIKVKFADQAQIPAWSQAAIAAAVSGGYMNGYPDGTFQPTKPITRAEAISVLNRAVGTLYNMSVHMVLPGMTLLEGNVTINNRYYLQNTTITGNSTHRRIGGALP